MPKNKCQSREPKKQKTQNTPKKPMEIHRLTRGIGFLGGHPPTFAKNKRDGKILANFFWMMKIVRAI
jgi:hypothetical protein